MSIIYDALKKVENLNQKNLEVKPDKDHGRPKFNPKPYLLYAAIICLGFFIGSYLFNILGPAKDSSLEQIKQPLADISGKPPRAQVVNKDIAVNPPLSEDLSKETLPSSPPVSLAKDESPVVFVLNGVFFSQDQGYALINNHIVKKGDIVDGAVVKQITLDEVELENAGLVVKLSSKPN